MFIILPRPGPTVPSRPRVNERHPFMQAPRRAVALPNGTDLCANAGYGLELQNRRSAQYGAPYWALMPQSGYEATAFIGGGALSAAETITLFAIIRTWSTSAGANIGGIVSVLDNATFYGLALGVNTSGGFSLGSIDAGGTTQLANTANTTISGAGEWWAVAGTAINNSSASIIRAKQFAGPLVSESATSSKNRSDSLSAPVLAKRTLNSFQKGLALWGFSLRHTPVEQLVEWVLNPMGLIEEEPARRYFFDLGFPATAGTFSVGVTL